MIGRSIYFWTVICSEQQPYQTLSQRLIPLQDSNCNKTWNILELANFDKTDKIISLKKIYTRIQTNKFIEQGSLSVRICTLFAIHLTNLFHSIAYSLPFLNHQQMALSVNIIQPRPHCQIPKKEISQGHRTSLVPLGLVYLFCLFFGF